MRKNLFIFTLLLLACFTSYAQDEDELLEDEDTTFTDEGSDSTEAVTYREIIYRADPDTTNVEGKSFSKESFDRLKSDPDLNFEQPPTIGESLWDRFWAWLAQFFDSLFQNAVTTNWGRLIVYAIGLALLVVLIMMMLKVNAFNVLYSGEGRTQNYQVLDENIHEMDFETLISEAMAQKDYRKGVRLVFLYALKLLSDKDLIHFESGKTNHDYVAELQHRELKTGFNELSFYFEYAWYGNFNITRDTFKKMQDTFYDWKGKINA